MQVSSLTPFGTDINQNNKLEENELNALGQKALERGFFELDQFTGQKVITVELAEKAAKEVDGKFTVVAALKESGRGLHQSFIKPFKDHPIRTTAIVASVMGLTLVVEAAAPIAAAVAAGVGVFKLTRGLIKMIKALAKKDGDAAETAFRDIAPGTVLTAAFGPATVGKFMSVAGLSGASGAGAAGAASSAGGAAVCPGGT